MAYVSGNIPTKYVQKNGTFTYLHVLDPEIPIDCYKPVAYSNQWL